MNVLCGAICIAKKIGTKAYAEERLNMKDDFRLQREDYTDPVCPFCTDDYQKNPPVRKIPTARILEKADAFFGRNDYQGAERLFLYWLEEARLGKDLRGEFQIRNELMGLYRKLGRRSEALENATRALELIPEAELEGTVGAGTCYVNAATVRKAFGMAKEALPLYEKAQSIYEKYLKPDDPMLAGLSNNMALALVDLNRYAEARRQYEKALSIVSVTDGCEVQAAATYLNLANLTEAEQGLSDGADEIERLLSAARSFLDKPGIPHDGNYAFYCEKCAPTFDYYGHFAYAKELEARAGRIYERN